MTASAIQPSDAATCQARTMTAGTIHPIQGRPCGTLSRSVAARSRGPMLTTGLCAISVNPISRARRRRAAALGVALPRPNNVLDADRRRNQTELLEAVRDRLLLGEDVVIERPECEFRSINRSLLRSKINAARFGKDGRDLIAVLVSPSGRRRDGAIDRGDYLRVLAGEAAVNKKERVLRGNFSIEGQGARFLLQLRDGEERIPNRPGVDRAADEGGGGVRRSEINRSYRGPRKLDAFERGDEQIMCTGRLGDRHFLTLEAGDALDRRSGRNDDRLSVAASGNRCGVEQVLTGRLCEDRRGVTRIAVVDRSSSERLKQRRSKSKLDPSDPHTLRFKPLLKRLLRLHDQECAYLLITDPQFLEGFSGDRRACERRCQRGRYADQNVPFIHSRPSSCFAKIHATSSVLPLPGHKPGFEEAHGEGECEGASRNNSDADKDDVRRQEFRCRHDEIADASRRCDKLSGDERAPADAE